MLRRLESFEAWLDSKGSDPACALHRRFLFDGMAYQRLRIGGRVPDWRLVHSGMLDVWSSLMAGSNVGAHKKGRVNYTFDVMAMYHRLGQLPDEIVAAASQAMCVSMSGEDGRGMFAEEMSETTVATHKSGDRAGVSATNQWSGLVAGAERHAALCDLVLQAQPQDEEAQEAASIAKRVARDVRNCADDAKRVEQVWSEVEASAAQRYRGLSCNTL